MSTDQEGAGAAEETMDITLGRVRGRPALVITLPDGVTCDVTVHASNLRGDVLVQIPIAENGRTVPVLSYAALGYERGEETGITDRRSLGSCVEPYL